MSSQFTSPFKTNNKNKKVAYINARIIDPETKYDKVGSLLTIGDKISDFGENIEIPKDAEIIDCEGNILCPGFVDLHVHLRDPGVTHKEDIRTGTMAAVAGGVTTLVCQPNTCPVIDSVEVIEYIKNKATEEGFCNVLIYATVTKGQKNEELSNFDELRKAGAIGFTDDGLPVSNDKLMRSALAYSAKYDVIIAEHAEDKKITSDGCIHEGLVAKQLGVKGIPNISEYSVVKRDLGILEEVGGHYHLMHISAKESLDAIRVAKKKGLNVTVEVMPHHFSATDELVLEKGALAKVAPPLRTEQDRMALIKGLQDGTIDIIATDHAPHEPKSKSEGLQKSSFGIAGLETLLPLSLQLYFGGYLSLIELLAKITCKPADIIKQKAGRIKKGNKADLVLFDLNKEYEINPESFHSKSKNSPFGGKKVKGKVIMTIINGVCVFK